MKAIIGQKFRKYGQLPRLNQWTLGSSNTLNDAKKEEIQLGGIYFYKKCPNFIRKNQITFVGKDEIDYYE